MKKYLFLTIITLWATNLFAANIEFLTHSSEQQTYIDEYGELRGKKQAGKRAFYVEVVRETMTLMNHPKNIRQIPFKRALIMVQNNSNTAFFNVSRIPEREDRYKWVGPLIENISYLYELKDQPTQIQTLEDAKKLNKICVLNGAIHEEVLLKNNFTNLIPANSYISCFKMLKSSRVSATPSASNSLLDKLRHANLAAEEVQQTPVIVSQSNGFIVFSKDVPDQVIRKWQSAIEQIKKSGKYQQIHEQYMASESD